MTIPATVRSRASVALALVLALGSPVLALEPGIGGKLATECIVEYDGFRLNYPPPPSVKRKEFRCFDGDPTCDTDGVRNGSCAMSVSLCFAGNDVPGCTAGTVSEVKVSNPPPTNPKHDPALAALQSAGQAVLPTAGPNVCGAPAVITVPIGKKSAKKLKVRATSSTGKDSDSFKLRCVKSGWTKYMHDLSNSGSNPDETTLGVANVGSIVQKWEFVVKDKTTPHYISAAPTVADDRVYIGSWNGMMYALRATDGKVLWKFDTADPNPGERGGLPGIQSSATVLADGRVYFGAADGKYYSLDDHGRLLWSTSIGNPDEVTAGGEGAHAWSSPAVHDGKVFVGRASHDDGPCIRGRFYALDQDTGAIQWQFNVVPEFVCTNAPATVCTTDGDCPGGSCVSNRVCSKQSGQFCQSNADCDSMIAGNTCNESRGGAIWSSAAVDPARNEVYVTTGDCLQQGAIGDAESIMAFDLDTGARLWAHQANSLGETADFDYGSSAAIFSATDGVTTCNLVGAGNKNGSYAVDADTASSPGARRSSRSVFGGFLGSSAHGAGQIFSGTFTGPPYVHALNAFDGTLGTLSVATTDARTFAAATYANGVVYIGSQRISFSSSGQNRLRAFDASTGTTLLTLGLPGGVSAGAAIVDGMVYASYGTLLDAQSDEAGGVRAYGLP
jgi:polyvinyl alcohol dehydrogenase (cytochrome)